MEILYLYVGLFDIAMGFYYWVWNGQESFGVECLNIYQYVVYPSPMVCIDVPLE